VIPSRRIGTSIHVLQDSKPLDQIDNDFPISQPVGIPAARDTPDPRSRAYTPGFASIEIANEVNASAIDIFFSPGRWLETL
jgi:hypothetical protein